MEVGTFSVTKLLNKFSPLKTPHLVWPGMSDIQITIDDIKTAIAENRLVGFPKSFCDIEDVRLHHIGRLAYLTVNGWKEDVPLVLNFNHPDWIIQDGNHRLCVAALRGDTHIKACYNRSQSELAKIWI